MRNARLAVVVAGALGALAGPASAQPLRFTLDVSPTAGSLTDSYEAVVQIELAGLAGPDRYVPPDFGDFQVLDSKVTQGTSSVVDPRRGQAIRTTIVRRYSLRPRTTGRLRIKAARLRIDRVDYETREVWVHVRGAGPGGGASATADPTAAGGAGVPGFTPPDPRGASMFLHAVADRPDPHVGQQVTVTWLLYTRSEVLKFEPRPPGHSGYTSEILFEPSSYFTYHEDTVGGVTYAVAVVSKRAIFPGRAGKLELPPYEARVATLETPLGQPVALRSKPVVLEVRPLPPGAPPGFDPTWVGTFTVEAKVDRAELDAAEALTLELTVEGEGDIRNLAAPRLAFPGFAFRAPRDDQPSVDSAGGTVRGKRVFRYWTTPERGGPQEVPAIELAFFDPAAGTYRIAATRPIPILVRGDPSQLAAAAQGSRDNRIGQDIRLVHLGDAMAGRTAPLLYRQPWYWALVLAAPLLFGLVVVTDRLRQRRRRETPRARLRRARGKARQHFRVAEIHIKGNRPAKFFAELQRALYEHLEERIGQPIQSMTRDELREFLRKKGFDNPLINAIDLELEQCDFARFAPSMANATEMRAAQRKVKELLVRIERTQVEGGEP
jgi:hypothetical protein